MDAKEKKALAISIRDDLRAAKDRGYVPRLNNRDLGIAIEALAQYIDNLEGVK